VAFSKILFPFEDIFREIETLFNEYEGFSKIARLSKYIELGEIGLNVNADKTSMVLFI
jgi:hypothetical protein